jgi:alpha-L-rhamnosidase
MQIGKWIWCAGQNPQDYNLAARFRKRFEVAAPKRALLRITADSHYRVLLNGSWINDGPGKAYPEHYIYDSYDISERVCDGWNEIEVIARYYGVGTFHQLVQQAGLIAEVEIDGRIIASDESWLAAPMEALRQAVPKVSCQMEPLEWYDARLGKQPDWRPAVAYFSAGEGPWRDLSERVTKALSLMPCRPLSVHSVQAMQQQAPSVCVPVTRIAHPGLIETNHRTSRPVILSSVLHLEEAVTFNAAAESWRVAVDGQLLDGVTRLEPGALAIAFFCTEFYGHNKEVPFPFLHEAPGRWGAWRVHVHQDYLLNEDDMIWLSHTHPRADPLRENWLAAMATLATGWTDPARSPQGWGLEVQIAHFYRLLAL